MSTQQNVPVLQRVKMAARISKALHKKAPELFWGAYMVPFDVVAIYLPRTPSLDDPLAKRKFFGAIINATEKTILFWTHDDVDVDEATEAIIAAPAEAWASGVTKPIEYVSSREVMA